MPRILTVALRGSESLSQGLIASTTHQILSVATKINNMILTKDSVKELARETLAWPESRQWSQKLADTKCRGFFGAPTGVIADLWNRLSNDVEGGAPKHLLWGLLLIKVYSTEEVHCRIVGWPDPQTFRKWSWYFVEKIADLEATLILLDNRFTDSNQTQTCFMSVDGTDCPVMEPWPFDKKWYSEKLNGPGVKYEVGVCIKTGEIVWFKGPFVASKNDSTIFIEDLANRLCDNEGVEVDAGYKGHNKLKSKMVSISRAQRKQKSAVRSRHEIINSRLKQFSVLNYPFRHLNLGSEDMMFKHGICFGAIAVITHLKMQAGEGTTYDVEYDIGYN
jgi:hypothetical protein